MPGCHARPGPPPRVSRVERAAGAAAAPPGGHAGDPSRATRPPARSSSRRVRSSLLELAFEPQSRLHSPQPHPHAPLRPAPRPLVDPDAAGDEPLPLSRGHDARAAPESALGERRRPTPTGRSARRRGAALAVLRPAALRQRRPARRALERARRPRARGRGRPARSKTQGARALQRLGGAALPYVLPLLDTLSPEARGRAAVALAPVAERMGLADRTGLDQPETRHAVLDALLGRPRPRLHAHRRRARRRAPRRARERSARARPRSRSTRSRCPRSCAPSTTGADRATLERLTRIAHHASERGTVDRGGRAPDDGAARPSPTGRSGGSSTATDFVALDGADRAIARGHRDALRQVAAARRERRARPERRSTARPSPTSCATRAPVTLLVCALAMALQLGARRAHRRAGRVAPGARRSTSRARAVMFVLYATPTFAVAELLRRTAAAHGVERRPRRARGRGPGRRVARDVLALAARGDARRRAARTSCAPRTPRGSPGRACSSCTRCATRSCPP